MFGRPNEIGAGEGAGVGPGVGPVVGPVVGPGHLPPAAPHRHGGHFGAHPTFIHGFSKYKVNSTTKL